MEKMYGLVNEQNILIDSVMVDDQNLSILDTLLQLANAVGAHELDIETDIIIIGETRWNGSDWEPKKSTPV